jgi:acetyl esterase/lipase
MPTPMNIRFDLAAPYEVEASNVVFARPQGTELLATVHRPKGRSATPLPALVEVHGGAWTRFDRTSGAAMCRALAACGLVVVAIDFRQGPDHQHPAASADVAAGVRWVRAHATPLGVDPKRIALVGSSSGGHLVLLHAVRPGAPEHTATPIVLADGSLSTAPGGDAVAFVLALYPVTDPLARYRYVLTREHEPQQASGFFAPRLVAAHRGFFKDEAAMAEASVTRIVAAGQARALPPVWLAQPELDDNVPAAITEAFVQAYRTAGGRIEHAFFPGARHGFNTTPGPDADKAVALMRDYIGRQLVDG